MGQMVIKAAKPELEPRLGGIVGAVLGGIVVSHVGTFIFNKISDAFDYNIDEKRCFRCRYSSICRKYKNDQIDKCKNCKKRGGWIEPHSIDYYESMMQPIHYQDWFYEGELRQQRMEATRLSEKLEQNKPKKKKRKKNQSMGNQVQRGCINCGKLFNSWKYRNNWSEICWKCLKAKKEGENMKQKLRREAESNFDEPWSNIDDMDEDDPRFDIWNYEQPPWMDES